MRDKDAVVASMLICEMAAYYKKKGKTLAQVIDEMYEQYGYYLNTTLSFTFEGAEGMKKMQNIMNELRINAPSEIGGFKVIKTDDYLESVSTDKLSGETNEIKLPKSNVIAFSLEGENAVIVRPSGTEPKIKLYITAVGSSRDNAAELTKELTSSGEKLMNL